MKYPVVTVLVCHADQVFFFGLVSVFVLFSLFMGYAWQLNINPLCLSLDVAAANEFILKLVYFLYVKVEKTMTLSVPRVRSHDGTLPNGLHVYVSVIINIPPISFRHLDFS